MKKHLFYLCALWAATVILSACDKDPIKVGGEDAHKSFLTVQFGISSPLTKTDNSGATIEGSEAESNVSQAIVYLVQSGLVKAVLPVNTLNRISYSGYDNGYETSLLETDVAVGTYEVFVYAGTTTDPFGYQVNDSWKSDATQSFSAKSLGGIENASNTAADDYSFRMFSQNDASVTGNTVPTVTLTAENNRKTNPAIADGVYLDRITAKITATEDASLKVGDNIKQGAFAGATAKIEGILPISAAQNVYIRQQWADAQKTVLSTPATERYGFVNNQFTATGFSYSDIQTSGGAYSSVSVADLSGKIIPPASPLYVLENAAESTPVWGTTTGVVFKVTLNASGSGSPATFFGYNKNSEQFLTLASLQANYPDAFDVFGNTLPGGADDDAANLAEAEALLASDPAAFRAKTKVMVFEDGAMYYTFFIKDDNYDCYGIFRNTWYQLLVTEITNFGDDVPGGWHPDDPTANPNPDTPVVDEKLYIKVKILVNKWVSNVTTIHLGE